MNRRGIEVVYFLLAQIFPENGCNCLWPDGEMTELHMGSYGIGVSRLVGAVIEASHDDKGIVWPANISLDAGIVVEIGMHDR